MAIVFIMNENTGPFGNEYWCSTDGNLWLYPLSYFERFSHWEIDVVTGTITVYS